MASALGMLTFSLISTLKQHVLYYRNKLAAPYPYSKMCELCELCELFVKNPTALAMGLASLINIYVCEIVYLFQDQTIILQMLFPIRADTLIAIDVERV